MARTLEELDVLVRQLQGLVASGVHVAGDLKASARSSAEDGWVLCDGSSLLRADYAALFAAIGTTYGSADGTHFNLPDLRGRVPVGVDGGAGRIAANDALGNSAGAETHTLATGEMPSHSHGGSTGTGTTGNEAGHTHGLTGASWSGAFSNAGGGAAIAVIANPSSSTTGAGSPHSHSVPALSISAEGGGGSHNNLQPYQVVNWFVKT